MVASFVIKQLAVAIKSASHERGDNYIIEKTYLYLSINAYTGVKNFKSFFSCYFTINNLRN